MSDRRHETISSPVVRSRGRQLSYFDYSGYPEYPQLFPPFDHHVSVLDLIFNQGRMRPGI